MYHMPPEVLAGERPGLFGLSLRQLMAALLGVFLSAALADGLLVQAGFALVGVVLARRARGLYAAESFYYLGRWFLVARILGEDEEAELDPERLYRAAPREHRGTTYVVRSPAGQVITVRR